MQTISAFVSSPLDLLDDAHNTFIKEEDDFEGEHEMQMDELNRN